MASTRTRVTFDMEPMNAVVARIRAAMERADRSTWTAMVLADVRAERARQTELHGDQAHLPDGTGPLVRWAVTLGPAYEASNYLRGVCQLHTDTGALTFLDILLEEVAEVFEQDDQAGLYAELVQVAAVAVQWAEAIRRREPQPCGVHDYEDPALGRCRTTSPACPGYIGPDPAAWHEASKDAVVARCEECEIDFTFTGAYDQHYEQVHPEPETGPGPWQPRGQADIEHEPPAGDPS